MKTLAIKNGDIVTGPGGYVAIKGVAKVQQDLSVAIREPFGSDPFHPRWGSTLETFIGEPVPVTVALVKSEVERVVTNYMAAQRAMLEADRTKGVKPRIGAAEFVSEILGISVTQDMDRLNVNVSLRVLDGQSVEINQEIGTF